MRVRQLLQGLAAALVLIPSTAPAFEIDFGELAADATVVDFEGNGSALPSIPGMQFVQEGSSSSADWFSGGSSGHNGELFGERALSNVAFRGNFSAVGVEFDTAVGGVGAWVSDLSDTATTSASVITISAFDAAGALIDELTLDLGFEGEFLGIGFADARIARVEWAGNGGYFGVDDITFGSIVAMPEPGTGVLLALGLGGFAAVRRRSRA